jgi:hypothetical protein
VRRMSGPEGPQRTLIATNGAADDGGFRFHAR